MNLDKYIEDSKKNNSVLVVLIDGDKVSHVPVHRTMLESPKGLEIAVKSLIGIAGIKVCDGKKCSNCRVQKK